MIITSNSVLGNLGKAKFKQQYTISQHLHKPKLNLNKIDLKKIIHLIKFRSIVKQLGNGL